MNKLKDFFAPVKGLESGADGKLDINKEKVEVRTEIEFEKRDENLVADELKNMQSKKASSLI